MQSPLAVRVSAPALIACLLAAPHARANLIQNGGFETPVLAVGDFHLYNTGDAIGAWTVVGDPGATEVVGVIQAVYAEPANAMSAFPPEEGFNCIDLSGSSNSGLASGVQQAVSTIPGRSYLVSFYVGRAAGGEVYSTPTTLDLSIAGGPRAPFTSSGVTPNSLNWQRFTTSFVATGASTTLTFYNGQTSNNFTGLDDVVVTEACYANCDQSTAAPILNANDFQCFINAYAAGTAYANCDQSTSPPILNANDFQCFLNAFAAGCS